MTKIKILLFISLILFIQCKKDPVINTDEIIPLQIGNCWTYKTTVYDTLGKVRPDSEFERNIEITETILIDGDIWYRLWTTHTYVKNFSDGLYMFDNTSYYDRNKHLYLKYPCNSGDPDVVSNNIKIEIAIGIFDCVQYKFQIEPDYDRNFPAGYNIEYYAPNIGLIKSEVYRALRLGDSAKIYFLLKEELTNFKIIR